MSNQNLSLALRIQALVTGQKEVQNLYKDLAGLAGQAGKSLPDNTAALRAGAQSTRDMVAQLASQMGGLVTAGALLRFAEQSVQAFGRAEAAFRGLESVATYTGVGIGRAMQEATKLSADGLLSLSDASKALQNLLSRGYTVDQAVATLTRLKDSAAFNRQAALSMSEAVLGATEGLKNENSMLVDNAGVTKNVAKMWEDYAAKIGKAATELTQAEKIQAEYAGIMAETEAQLGNAAKAMQGYQGQMAQSAVAVDKFKTALGEGLIPVTTALAKSGTFLIENFFKPMVFLAESAGVRVGQVAGFMGRLWEAVKAGGGYHAVTALIDGAKADAKVAEQEITAIASRLNSGAIAIAANAQGGPDADRPKEVQRKLLEGAKKNTEAHKKLIEERIKDYQALASAVQKAFEDSIEAEASAIDKAKALRAKAGDIRADTAAKLQDKQLGELAKTDPQAADNERYRTAQEALNQADVARARATEARYRGDAASLKEAEKYTEQADKQVARANDLASALQDAQAAMRLMADAGESSARNAEARAQIEDARAAAESQRQAGLRAEWAASQQAANDLQKVLDTLGKPVAISIQSEQAKTALDAIEAKLAALKDKTITVSVTAPGLDNLSDLPAKATGGLITGPGSDTSDNLLAWLSPGEFVMRAAAVRQWGASRLAALNAGRMPAFAAGGLVTRAVAGLPAFSNGGLVSGAGQQPINITLPGLGTWPMRAEPAVAQDFAATLRREAMKRGG